MSEIAQIIGISEGTVKSRLYYAKHKLHEMLKGVKDV
ncbi:MAG: RNA polymerase sigma factor [Planctomycetota bacterium]